MPSTSPLTISTNAVIRLLKEEEYYRKDFAAQQKRIQQMKVASKNDEDPDNASYLLKQRVSPIPSFGALSAVLRIKPSSRKLHSQSSCVSLSWLKKH